MFINQRYYQPIVTAESSNCLKHISLKTMSDEIMTRKWRSHGTKTAAVVSLRIFFSRSYK